MKNKDEIINKNFEEIEKEFLELIAKVEQISLRTEKKIKQFGKNNKIAELEIELREFYFKKFSGE